MWYDKTKFQDTATSPHIVSNAHRAFKMPDVVRHVRRRAHDPNLVLEQASCAPKVPYLRHPTRDKDILGLDVTVDHFHYVVHVGQTADNVPEISCSPLRSQASAFLDCMTQVGLQELHLNVFHA